MSESLNLLVEKPSLCPPIGTYDNNSTKILDNLYDKLENCGKNFVEYVHIETKDIVEFPSFCDNRVCSNPACKKHRGYKFKKEHIEQIHYNENNIISPKGWVFTDLKIPLYKINRKYLQSRKTYLKKLLDKFSISPYDLHMEIKTYPNESPDYGLAFIHFHVVSGGIANLKLVRKLWKHHITYETAIKPKNLSTYICKYSSKSPYLTSNVDVELYHKLVYKLQMHQFSQGKKSLELCQRSAEYYPLDLLRFEIYNTLKNISNKNRYYYKFVDEYEHPPEPPPENFELDAAYNLHKIKFITNKKYKSATLNRRLDEFEL